MDDIVSNNIKVNIDRLKEEVEEGDIFLLNRKSPYIVAQVTASKYCLVSLATGNRWRDPRPKEEIFGGGRSKFDKLEKGHLDFHVS